MSEHEHEYITPRDVLDYATRNGWTIVDQTERGTTIQLDSGPILYVSFTQHRALYLVSTLHALAEKAGMTSVQLAAQLGYEKAQREITQALPAATHAADLRHMLVRGLGLANEIGADERWAAWRLKAHQVLTHANARGDDPTLPISRIVFAAQDYAAAVRETNGIQAAEQVLLAAVAALEETS